MVTFIYTVWISPELDHTQKVRLKLNENSFDCCVSKQSNIWLLIVSLITLMNMLNLMGRCGSGLLWIHLWVAAKGIKSEFTMLLRRYIGHHYRALVNPRRPDAVGFTVELSKGTVDCMSWQAYLLRSPFTFSGWSVTGDLCFCHLHQRTQCYNCELLVITNY